MLRIPGCFYVEMHNDHIDGDYLQSEDVSLFLSQIVGNPEVLHSTHCRISGSIAMLHYTVTAQSFKEQRDVQFQKASLKLTAVLVTKINLR